MWLFWIHTPLVVTKPGVVTPERYDSWQVVVATITCTGSRVFQTSRFDSLSTFWQIFHCSVLHQEP